MAMPSPATQTDREVLAGIVERVTFHNADTGFCVLRVKARGHRDLATIVGHAASISAGEWITASGNWVNDREHGLQSKARFPSGAPGRNADNWSESVAVPDPERSYSRRVSASVNVRLGTRSLVGLGPSQGRAMPLPSWQASRCIRTRRQSSGPPQRRTDCFVSSRLAMPRVVRAERSPGQDRHFRRQPLRRTKRASRRCRRRSFPPPFPRS